MICAGARRSVRRLPMMFPARIFWVSVYDRNSAMFSFTTSARCVVSTVAGSPTVQFADRA